MDNDPLRPYHHFRLGFDALVHSCTPLHLASGGSLGEINTLHVYFFSFQQNSSQVYGPIRYEVWQELADTCQPRFDQVYTLQPVTLYQLA